MRISGEMTKREQFLLRIAFWFLLSFCAVLAVQTFRLVGQPSFQKTAMGEHIAIYLVLAPLFAFQLLFAGSQFRRNSLTIVEFECDENSIQFRKLGETHKETRPLYDIVKVYKWRGLGEPVGYRLLFRDGTRAFVNYSLSNAKALEDRLRAADVPVHRWLESLRDLA